MHWQVLLCGRGEDKQVEGKVLKWAGPWGAAPALWAWVTKILFLPGGQEAWNGTPRVGTPGNSGQKGSAVTGRQSEEEWNFCATDWESPLNIPSTSSLEWFIAQRKEKESAFSCEPPTSRSPSALTTWFENWFWPFFPGSSFLTITLLCCCGIHQCHAESTQLGLWEMRGKVQTSQRWLSVSFVQHRSFTFCPSCLTHSWMGRQRQDF